MKHLLWIVISLCFFFCAKAQIQLTGKVTDKITGEALAQVAIYFPDLRQGAMSESSGEFKFSQLPKGRFNAVVKYVGYASQSFSISLMRDTTVEILLEPTVAELQDVV